MAYVANFFAKPAIASILAAAPVLWNSWTFSRTDGCFLRRKLLSRRPFARAFDGTEVPIARLAKPRETEVSPHGEDRQLAACVAPEISACTGQLWNFTVKAGSNLQGFVVNK